MVMLRVCWCVCVVGVPLVYRVRRVSSEVLAGKEGGIRFRDCELSEFGVWWPRESIGWEAVSEDVGREERVRSLSMGGLMLARYCGGRCAGSGLIGRWSWIAADKAAE